MAKWLFGKRTFFLFKQTNKPVSEGEVLTAVNKKGYVQMDQVQEKIAENVAEIPDPSTATAKDCANKINEIIAALIAAGLMDSGVS